MDKINKVISEFMSEGSGQSLGNFWDKIKDFSNEEILDMSERLKKVETLFEYFNKGGEDGTRT